MHLPNAGLSCPVTIGTAAAASVALVAMVRKLRAFTGRANYALAGFLTAFIFVMQMFDVTILNGTTGHYFGGVLAAVLVGPAVASMLMAAVLIAQCLLLGDGGFTVLGANILNMAVIGPWVGWAAYQLLIRHGASTMFRATALFFASWLAIVASASAVAVELGLSHMVPLSLALPSMAGNHAVLGLGEGAITVIVAALAARAFPVLQASKARTI